MKKNRFVKNVAILTVTALLLRTVGIFFRVYLSGRLGSEGMGLYQLILTIYTLGSTFASAGICTAVTRLVTDELACGSKKAARRVLHRAIMLSVGIGMLSAAAIFFGADWIGGVWLGDVRAVPALKVLCFSLPSMGVSSCLKGYFMARRRASASSISQILEQTVRIAAVMFLLSRLPTFGITLACAAVLAADTVAEFSACLYLAVSYRLDRRKLPEPMVAQNNGAILPRLVSIAAPITVGRYLNAVLRTVESLLVPYCLCQYLGSQSAALSAFGDLKGMALPLIFFPYSFLSAVSTLLIPEISEAAALHRQKHVCRAVQLTLHITLLMSIFISGVFTVFAHELGNIFYGSRTVGQYLLVLAPLMPLMYLESVVDGLLKGLNQQVSSLKYSVLDSAVRILLIVVLVPFYGMAGFLFIMVISNLLTSLLNLSRLLRVTQVRPLFGNWLVKPVLAMGCAGMAVVWLLRLPALAGLSDIASLAVGGVVALILYLLLLRGFGSITGAELRHLKIRGKASQPDARPLNEGPRPPVHA